MTAFVYYKLTWLKALESFTANSHSPAAASGDVQRAQTRQKNPRLLRDDQVDETTKEK